MFSLDKELKREIEQMRLESIDKRRISSPDENSLNPVICLLFRWFLALTLFISGILFPQMNDNILPKELKELPVYISINHDWNEITDLMDSMAN